VPGEEHVIHATDQSEQTDYLLKMLGHDDGVGMFERNRTALLPELPYHIPRPHRVRFCRIPMALLRVGVLEERRGHESPVIRLLPVTETPHYEAYSTPEAYVRYRNRFRFRYLTDDHSLSRLLSLGDLTPKRVFSLGRIAVKRQDDGQYRVLDGAHRLAALARRDVATVPCVELAC
jgi:hypothetical protein